MRLGARRRGLVVWSHSAGRTDSYGQSELPQLARTGRVRRRIRIGVLLMVVGAMRFARVVRPRWRPLLAGTGLIAAGVVLRAGPWGILLLIGFWCLLYAFLIPRPADADSRRRSELARELAGYSTRAQRRDLEATLDRYADVFTAELREILTHQVAAAGNSRIPGARR